MTSIAQWQRDAFDLAKEKGFHSRVCAECEGDGHFDPDNTLYPCKYCNCTGQVGVDHKDPTRIASRLALIHCEISEAVECVVRGRMQAYVLHPITGIHVTDASALDLFVRSGGKPEGFPIELADVFLRTCDLAESQGLLLEDFEAYAHKGSPSTPEQLVAELGTLHAYAVAVQRDWPLEMPENLSNLLTHVLWLARAVGVDLYAMAEIKHEYNKTRPIMHGGKLL